MKVKMKPETIARRARERAAERAAKRADLIRRLEAKVAEHGPKSIWAEMLAEQLAENPTEIDDGMGGRYRPGVIIS
jgi:hypothetical protein